MNDDSIIKIWLCDINKTQMWLANKLAITNSRLSRIITGDLNIKLAEAVELKRLSRGKIKLDDLVSIYKKKS